MFVIRGLPATGRSFIADLISVARGKNVELKEYGSCRDDDKLYLSGPCKLPENWNDYDYIIYDGQLKHLPLVPDNKITLIDVIPPTDYEGIILKNTRYFYKYFLADYKNGILDWPSEKAILDKHYEHGFNTPDQWEDIEFIEYLHHLNQMPPAHSQKYAINSYKIEAPLWSENIDLKVLIKKLGLQWTDQVNDFVDQYFNSQENHYKFVSPEEILDTFREINSRNNIFICFEGGTGGTTLATVLALLMWDDKPPYIPLTEYGESVVNRNEVFNRGTHKLVQKVNGRKWDEAFVLREVYRNYHKIHATHWPNVDYWLEKFHDCKIVAIIADKPWINHANCVYKNDRDPEKAKGIYNGEIPYRSTGNMGIIKEIQDSRVLNLKFSELFDAEYVIEELIDFFQLDPSIASYEAATEYLTRWQDAQIFK